MRKLLVVLGLVCPVSMHAADSSKTVRQLRVGIPELPSVAAVFERRGCTIPQPNKGGPAHNVIRGEFFGKRQKAWAGLCSRSGRSSILVFRNDHDTSPDEIAESPDERFLIDTGQGWSAYLREIPTVGRKFIFCTTASGYSCRVQTERFARPTAVGCSTQEIRVVSGFCCRLMLKEWAAALCYRYFVVWLVLALATQSTFAQAGSGDWTSVQNLPASLCVPNHWQSLGHVLQAEPLVV